jgi:hypothetical protein
LTAVDFFRADYRFKLVLRRTVLAPYVKEASIVLFGQALFQSSYATLVDWKAMGRAGSVSVLQALVKSSTAPVLAVYGGLGVEGILVSILCSNSLLVVLGLTYTKKCVGSSPEMEPVLGILGAAATYAVTAVISASTVASVAFLVDLLVYFISYFTVVPILGVIDTKDVTRFSRASNSLGVLRAPVRFVLAYEVRLMRVRGTR